jgi:hypothetical protein
MAEAGNTLMFGKKETCVLSEVWNISKVFLAIP